MHKCFSKTVPRCLQIASNCSISLKSYRFIFPYICSYITFLLSLPIFAIYFIKNMTVVFLFVYFQILTSYAVYLILIGTEIMKRWEHCLHISTCNNWLLIIFLIDFVGQLSKQFKYQYTQVSNNALFVYILKWKIFII